MQIILTAVFIMLSILSKRFAAKEFQATPEEVIHFTWKLKGLLILKKIFAFMLGACVMLAYTC